MEKMSGILLDGRGVKTMYVLVMAILFIINQCLNFQWGNKMPSVRCKHCGWTGYSQGFSFYCPECGARIKDVSICSKR